MLTSEKIGKHINFVTRKLDNIVKKEDLDIKDMADLQRYAFTLESLTRSKQICHSLELNDTSEVTRKRQKDFEEQLRNARSRSMEGYVPERG